MASKLQFYSTVAERAAKEATAKRGSWTDFLDTAARLYKYSFPDQLMIHAQRPGATACAPMETWNDSFNRWVCRGAKGIALIDDTGSYPKLKYVFDVSDTEPSLHNSRPVHLWEMRQEHKAPVLEALAKTYDDVGDTLADSFRSIAKQLAGEYYQDNAREIRYRAENSFLEEFDDFNLGVAFEEALTVSIAYTLMSRCGFDTAEYFEDDDFKCVFDFNTPDMVYALGTATSELSEQVLRDVELVIKKHERQHAVSQTLAAERSVTNEHTHDLHTERGLSSARPDLSGTAEGADGAARTVRADEESVFERASDDNVQFHAPVGEAVPASAGDGTGGEREAGAGDERPNDEELPTRQNDRPDGLDSGDERAESTGGGNGLERTNLQLEHQAVGAAEEAAPFSMAELAQYHTDWNERLINGVLGDEAVINAAVNSDNQNTLIEIENALKRLRLAISQDILDSATIKNKGGLVNELDSYFTKERKPPFEQQLYDTIIRSDAYKERFGEQAGNETPPEQELPDSGDVFPVAESYSQLGNSLTVALGASSVTLDEVDAILRDGGNGKNSVLRIAVYFSKGKTPEDNEEFLHREYLSGRYGHHSKADGKGFQFGTKQISIWFDDTGITIGRGKSALSASDRAHLTWEQAAERVKALYDAGEYVSHDVLDEALYNESVERADDIVEVYGNIQRGLGDILYELRRGMDKAQQEATKDDWKHRRYLISGLTALNDKADEALNGDASPEEIMQLYSETLRISEEIPQEWGFNNGHPDVVKQVAELLRDKGELSARDIKQGIGYSELSEYNLILTRLREDIAELKNEPDTPIHFYRNPHRLLSNLEIAGLPPKGFPVAEIPTLNAMPFITDDEVDRHLTGGSHFSEGKFRILSYFLRNHTPKERAAFIKREYGHGGGTWGDKGWHNAEPGKGIELKRGNISKPDDTVSLSWSKAAQRIGELIQSGRYMTRAELNRIPEYEEIMLARQINNFYYNMMDYERPFADNLDFHYPHEEEWAELRAFLGDTERIDAVLGEMRRIYENTPEEDRYYDWRKAGFERLSEYREGTYTLFPNLDKLPDPELIQTRVRQSARPFSAPSLSSPIEAVEQMSLFGGNAPALITDTPLPLLPSVEEQQSKLEQSAQQSVVDSITQPPIPRAELEEAVTITQDEIDALLLGSVETTEQFDRIISRFTENPRSREAAQLIKDIYSDGVYLMHRLDGAEGYMGLMGDSAGLTLSKGEPRTTPMDKRKPSVSLDLPWAKVHRRVAELVESGRFQEAREQPPFFHSPQRFIPYRAGDAVDAVSVDNAHIKLIIDRIEEDYVYYTMPDDVPEQEPVEMFRSRFEGYLDDGRYTIMEPGASLPPLTPKEPERTAENNITEQAPAETITPPTPAPEPEATPAVTVSYNIGDRLAYNGKPHEIDRIGDFVRLRNLGTPSAYPISDHVSVPKSRFERMLADGELSILPTALPEPAPELDFDTVAQMVLERVMQDADYSETLTGAKSRASLRNPCTWALEQSIRDHEQDEPEVYNLYFSDDDFNDRLFDYVLRQSWANRPTPEAATPEQAANDAAGPETPVASAERGRSYTVGDTVYLENDKPFIVERIGGVSVSLRDPSLVYPILRSESRDNLERLLRSNPKNQRFADYIIADLNDTNGDLLDVLNNGLFAGNEKDAVLRLLESNATNYEIAKYLSENKIVTDTMPLTGGETADYISFADGLEIEIPDKFNTKLSFTWADIAPILRTLEPQWLAIREAELAPDAVLPVAEKLLEELSPSGEETTAYYLFRYPDGTDESAALSHETLALIKERADAYVICAEVCYLSESDMERWNIGFRKMPRDWNLLPDAVQEQIRAVRLDYEKQWQELYGNLAGYDQLEQPETNHEPEPPQATNGDVWYRVGDKVYYDDTEYEIIQISEKGGYISLLDTDNRNHHESPEMFDSLLRTDSRNEQLRRDRIKPAPEISAESTNPPILIAGTNFRITDDHLGEGGAKTKFRYNTEAIKTLRDIELEKRSATPEEQQILSRYVGWGGIADAFDADKPAWANEYRELKALLTPEEYDSARASTLNAHYTSPTIIKAIYDTAERLGFKTGNILEPACGVGNFFGLLPESMKNSKLYGVELDGVTARIAKQLYPKANIKETGFERTDTPDAFFDLAIGNVPFGDYGVVDKRYDKHHFKIHDYFFAKALDQVRPGGIVAFVTSKGTLDKQNPEVRKYIAQRAELLGAVRLPNTAFLKNAGTEVTSDIIFLQKRDRPIDIEPDWVHLGLTDDGISVNRYFADNPEMMLGTMSKDDGLRMYGSENSTTCIPIEGADLAEQLKTALLNVQGQYTVEELDDIEGIDDHAIPADTHVKNFSYALVTPMETDGERYAGKIGEGQVYFRENSLMYPVDLPATTLERIKGMIGLRDCVQELIALQLDEHSDEEIAAQQRELDALYDEFSAEYGLINSTANSRAFNADSAYYLLCSLEIINEDGNLERKADMFTKRTIKQRSVVTHVDTASEALAVSLGEQACIDLDYMAQLTGFSSEKLIEDLRGVIFLNVGSAKNARQMYVTADEYLSGNVREKLAMARAAALTVGDGSLDANVQALEAAQPKDLDASEIAVRLGATWIDPEYVQQFMYELLKTPWRMQDVYQVKYHAFTGEWQVTSKGRAQYSDINATVTYGTSRMNAYQIIDDTLNLRDVRVYDYKEDADGKEKRVLNKKETTLAQQKQEQIKQAWGDWIWSDPTRRQTLVKQYNERFNSVRPREYDGSHITFSGISPEITLRPHQLNAIAHILYGGNTLLAHEVGAGKTFEMVGAAMESKRLGLCHKSLFAVPNHLTEQWAGEFLRLYPSANILVATKKDFEMRNRKKFCAKIATGDYDAVILGHTQLEKIPMSRERQERLLNEQLGEIEDGIDELKRSNGERFSIKQLEKTKKSLETRLSKLLDGKTRDDVVTFEQLGVDRLYVDEAHGFKNLFLYTKMRNVAGLSTSEAQKSSDLFMKCRYMDELTDNKGVIFATGTPISNSMTEMYTMQRYLQYDTLSAKNLTHFDCWASIFGETQTSIELAPEGTGYRARTRFSRFHNLPELMSMFKDVADIQTADMLNLPVPEAKYETIVVEPSELQKEMVEELSERAAAVHAQLVDAKVDNMLKITTDGRKIGLDQRLINPLLPDFEGSKVNACTDNVFRIWDETKSDRLTQLLFCDFSTPNKDGRFNIYDDIKAKLIERGIPEHEIAFIHDADTETRKKELFAKVRQGKVRVLFGSTFKMGAGTNVQDRLIAIHDADCPWRPADLAQRAGRIVRQGNKNDEVQIYRYVTGATFDAYLYQTLENKQKFIGQIMSSKSPVRSCEDVDETALSYAEIKALCAGNPLIAEKMNLDVEVAKLRMLKSEHKSLHYRLEDDLLKRYPEQITAVTERVAGIEKDIATYTEQKEKTVDMQPSITGGAVTVSAKFPGMVVNGVEYAEKEPAAKALLETCKGIADKADTAVGSYMGFNMSLRFDSFSKQFSVLLRGKMTYQAELGTDTFGNITRINNTLADLPKRLEGAKSQLETLYSQQEAAKLELEKPFALASELAEKEARLALLNADLNIDGDGGFDVTNDTDGREGTAGEIEPMSDDEYESKYGQRAASAKSAKPSILEGIRAFNAEKHQAVPGKKSTEREI